MMRTLITSLLIIAAFGLQAQESAFFKAMKKNDFSEVNVSMARRVELCIMDNQELYSKKETVKRIKSWLSAKNVTGLSEVHNGSSENKKSHYKVAKVTTDDGDYRLFVYVHIRKGQHFIKKIQIDRF